MPDGALVAYVATTLLVGVALWLLLQSFVLGALWHGRAQQELYADLRLALAAQTAPVGGDIAPQTPGRCWRSDARAAAGGGRGLGAG